MGPGKDLDKHKCLMYNAVISSSNNTAGEVVVAKHRAGKKLGRRHTTIIDAAVPVVDAAQKSALVSKVTLGLIKNQVGKSQHRSIKFSEIPAGFKVRVRGNTTIQELYVYTLKPQETRELLARAFAGK